MGHEIVYCVKCATRIAGTDFEKGKAVRVGGKAVCGVCLPEILPTLTPAEQQELSISSTRMRMVKEQQSLGKSSSVRIGMALRREGSPSPPPMILGVSIGAVVLIAGILAML